MNRTSANWADCRSSNGQRERSLLGGTAGDRAGRGEGWTRPRACPRSLRHLFGKLRLPSSPQALVLCISGSQNVVDSMFLRTCNHNLGQIVFSCVLRTPDFGCTPSYSAMYSFTSSAHNTSPASHQSSSVEIFVFWFSVLKAHSAKPILVLLVHRKLEVNTTRPRKRC